MISPDLLIIAGFVTAIFGIAAWWRWRGGFAPVASEMFLVMAGGALAVALFYIGVKYGAGDLPAISRWIWLMILLSTAFMAVSVLRIRKGNVKNGK